MKFWYTLWHGQILTKLSHVKDTRVFSPYEKYLERAKSRAQKACEDYQGFGASRGGGVSVHVILETSNSSPSRPCRLQPRRIPWECFSGLANGARCETLGSLSFWLLKWYLSAVLISIFFLQYNALKKILSNYVLTCWYWLHTYHETPLRKIHQDERFIK